MREWCVVAVAIASYLSWLYDIPALMDITYHPVIRWNVFISSFAIILTNLLKKKRKTFPVLHQREQHAIKQLQLWPVFTDLTDYFISFGIHAGADKLLQQYSFLWPASQWEWASDAHQHETAQLPISGCICTASSTAKRVQAHSYYNLVMIGNKLNDGIL